MQPWSTSLLRFVAVLTLAAPACGGPDEATTTADDTIGDDDLTWWRDVEPVVRQRCGECHVDGGIAPFALTTHEEFVGLAAIVGPAIEAGEMPPWPPDSACNEYAHARDLTPEQEETLLAYLDGDMPEGDRADAPPPPAAERELVPDLTLEMPEVYSAPTAVADDYRCFLIPWPADITEPRFVTGMEVYPGERRIVHHVIVYAVDAASLDKYAGYDDAEPGPGYTCYGGPGPSDGSARWVGGWVPGMAPFFAPEGVGQQIDPGTTLVMQVHYHPIGVALDDRSTVALEVATEVERTAEVVPLADLRWLAHDGSMLIPAGEPDVTHEFAADRTFPPLGFALARLGLPADADLEIFNVGLHMHTRGTRARLEIRGAAAEPACLLDIPRWDFNWQSGYDLAAPTVVRADQELAVSCWWDNSPTNQPYVDGEQMTPVDIDWGEGTNDEMCLGILYFAGAAG